MSTCKCLEVRLKFIRMKKRIVLIGNGMTGYKFCEKFVASPLVQDYELLVFGEEPHPAYDRFT